MLLVSLAWWEIAKLLPELMHGIRTRDHLVSLPLSVTVETPETLPELSRRSRTSAWLLVPELLY